MVQKVKFDDVAHHHAMNIMKSFGSQLKKLKFGRGSNQVDLLQLVLCPQLEDFVVGNHCGICYPSPVLLNAVKLTYLENLVKMKFLSCVGPRICIIELANPSLTHLQLNCCHFDVPNSQCQSTWLDVPDLWPNLRELSLRWADGLTLDKLLHIIPRLNFLQRLELPTNLLNAEELQQLKDEVKERHPSASISIETLDDCHGCCYQQNQDEPISEEELD